MESYDASGSTDITQTIPQGLIEPEKNVGEFQQMAEFSTAMDDVVPQGPGMQMQDMMMGSSGPPQQQVQAQQGQAQAQGQRKIPFGLTNEQYMAVLAGLAAVVSTSRPVQERLAQFGPSVEVGSMSAMALTALVAALVFYLAHRFLV